MLAEGEMDTQSQPRVMKSTAGLRSCQPEAWQCLQGTMDEYLQAVY